MVIMQEKIQQLRQFYDAHKRLPSYAEMMVLFNFKSKNAVAGVVRKLIDNGVLAKDGRNIVPAQLFEGVRLLGEVQAGFPTPAEEELVDTMTLDEWLIKKREQTYMLTVSGDSMNGAGILSGDTVLVERTSNPRVGDIVIAEVDGAWTMKYLRQKSNKFYLEPANEKYTDMYPSEELTIPAVVIAVIRRYEH